MQAFFFAHLFKLLLKRFNKKEVIQMAEKKNVCGCGCIPVKQASEKAAKDKKNVKKSK